MKVLLLTHHWTPYTHHSIFSGYERIAYYLNDFCDVDILTWKFRKIREDINSGLSVKRVFTPPSDILLERRLLISAAAFRYGKHYDVIHSLYSIPAFFPSFRYPTIATVHITSDINKKNIFVVEPNNSRALAEKILLALGDDELVKKFSEDSRDLAEEYSWDKIAERIVELYRCVLDGRNQE